MKKNGFTLAEVLITLAIIGIVAALTIPTLMTDSRYQLVSSRISKFVSVTEDAALAQAAMNGEISFNDLDGIILYKTIDEDSDGVERYELKDGTALRVSQNASENSIPQDLRDTAKYGTPMASLHFYHNVSGLSKVTPEIDFVMTNKGYVFPNAQSQCAMALFDKQNGKQNPWKLTKDLAEGDCRK